MTVLPDRLTVKRRRDEDPVDALYLQGKRHRSDICWRRVNDDGTLPPLTSAKIQDQSVGNTLYSSIEATSEARSLERAASISISQERPTDSSLSLSSNNDATRHSDQAEAQSVGRKRFNPPKFHLAKIIRQPSCSLPSSNSGVRKSKKPQERKLSVFQARAEPTRRVQSLLEAPSDHDALENKSSIIGADQMRPRKRPNVGAAEQARKLATQENYERKLTQKQPDARSSSKRLDLASEELALQLNAFALQELSTQTKKPQVISTVSKLKFQPKPPPFREQPEATGSCEAFNPAEFALDSAAERIDDYIYDMYLKSDAQPSSKIFCDAVTPDPSTEPRLQNFGYLMIDEEEEAAWAELGELSESDTGFDSDEVDENAEDYYGNDYPEDELSSDEKSSQGAYEVDSQNSDWSDEHV